MNVLAESAFGKLIFLICGQYILYISTLFYTGPDENSQPIIMYSFLQILEFR